MLDAPEVRPHNAAMGQRMGARRLAVTAILTYLAVGVLYTEAVPPWEAPDEPWHLAYTEAVADGRWPTPADTYESHQPPLYYVLTASVLRRLDITRVPRAPDNPWFPYAEAALWHVPGDPADPLLRLLRTLSAFLGAAVVALAWATTRAVAPQDRLRPALAGLTVAMWPQFVFSAHTINNDVLAAVSGGLLAYGFVAWTVSPQRRRWAAAVLAVGAASAVLTKVNAVALIAVAPLCGAIAMRAARGRGSRTDVLGRRWRRVFAPLVPVGSGLLLGAATVGALAPDVARRVVVDALGRGLSSRYGPADAPLLLEQATRTLSSLFGRFGWLNVDLPLPFTIVAAALAVAAVAGLARTWRTSTPREAAGRAVALAVILVSLLAVFKNLLADPQPQGRLLFPAVTAWAVLLSTGWLALVPRAGARAFAAIVVAFLLLVNVTATRIVLPTAYRAATGAYPDIDTRVMPPERAVVAVLGGETLTARQTFRVSTADVYSVEVAAAFARGPGSVTVSLLDQHADLVIEATLRLADIADRRWIGVTVPSRYLDVPGDLQLVLALDDPDGRLGLLGSVEDVYADGALDGTERDVVLLVRRRPTITPPPP